jgi:cellulose synthase/poly-beta-1,6-N-acetylglucosamine synthase-like glycosyltransferase/peptidoglycan/xylan/chitin deacetylase (PgdA/CDA1 family)/spore germination protein YaaH
MVARDSKQIFFDKSGKRGRAFRNAVVGVSAIGILLLSCMAGSIIANPRLPSLNLQGPKLSFLSKELETRSSEPTVSQIFNRHPHSASVYNAKRYAFMADTGESSLTSFKRNFRNIEVLMPAWLNLVSDVGGITAASDATVRAVTNVTAPNASALTILPVISDQDLDNQELVTSVLKLPATRWNLLDGILKFVSDYNLGGVVVDFRKLQPGSFADFEQFVKEAAEALHSRKLQLVVTVPLHDPKFDYELVSNAADYLILNIFDEHFQPESPGPIAGQAWFEKQLDDRLRNLDGGKVIVTIGSYAYDWTENNEVREISIQDAWDLAKISQSKLRLEQTSLNPTFSFQNSETGEKHKVWLLDAISAYNQAAAALAMDVHGIALWKLGSEDPGVWTFFQRGRIPDLSSLDDLKIAQSGYDVVYRGYGEALRVTGEQKTGQRTIKYDPKSNLITEESITAFPEGLTVTRWGATKAKRIALTFDDGPDPRYTPRILDVLAKKNVKATFFVIGSSASNYPFLLKRIYTEGHDIGNHTFTHPNLSIISHTQVELELNATQRFVEATLGINTVLFRPPYAEDVEPQTVDHAQALVTATELGYTAVGMKIDPHDWASPTKAQIVTQVVAQANQGTGNVVLLHDAGGSREQTIQALSELIDRLSAQGYEFVTVHELLGLDREAVMPHSQANNQTVTKFNAVGFKLIDYLGWTLSAVFIAALALSAARLLLMGGAAFSHWLRNNRRKRSPWRPGSIAVLVPAYNERETVCKTIDSLLASTVTNLEIIVIDDGSKDDTLKILRRKFRGNPHVRVLTKENGGKSSALNYGLENTDAEILIALDADTIFAPDAIELLVRHFEDPKTGAVAGAVAVGNQVNLITKFQALEYIVSQNFDRRALEVVNGIVVVPGAIGAWRRQALLDAGGFPHNTLAEDADATITLECQGWKILVEPEAVARTEAPETIKAFMKQRFRWTFGLLQVAYKHRNVMTDQKARGVAYCAIPNIVLFQFLLVLISPVMDVALLWNVFVVIVGSIMHPSEPTPVSFTETLWYWAVLQSLELSASALALAFDKSKGRWKLLPLLLLQRFGYRQLLAWIALKAAVSILRGQLVGWGKLARSGNVALPQPDMARSQS